MHKEQEIQTNNNKQNKQQQNQDGFSSDSDVLLEQQADGISVQDQMNQQVKQQMRQYLEKPQEFKDKSYSLRPDIQMGWTMRKELPKPIPLLFQNQTIDSIVTKSLRNQSFKARLIYLGARYESTLLAWHNQQFAYPYSHIPFPNYPKYSRRQFCGQKKNLPVDTAIFDSQFESGNLDAVFKIQSYEYDLFLRVDSNTRGHINWFNFKVKNLKKGEKYIFNICNFNKKSTLYKRGCRPYFFSTKKQKFQGTRWQQYGEVLSYKQQLSKTAKHFQVQSNHYLLKFQFQVKYQEDQIQIAYSIPYTYSDLMNYLQRLVQRQKKRYLYVNKICCSLGGLEVPLIIIDGTNQRHSSKGIKKKCIIISGRAHPGESNGSHMMQGFIEHICGNTKQVLDLRENVIFKIIPMLNPDGVALGNHRTGLSGMDFNRDFSNPNKKISTEVFALKKLVVETKQTFGDNLLMFLDFHGHSVKKNVFMYGPEFPVSNKNYYQCRIFPKILGQTSKLFRFYSCVFRISELKQSTARVVMLKKMKIPLSFTVEASNGSFYDYQQFKDIPFTSKKWEEMGWKIGEALNSYHNILVDKQIFLLAKSVNKKKSSRADLRNNKKTKKNSFCIQGKKTQNSVNRQHKQQSEYNYEALLGFDLLTQNENEEKMIKQIQILEKSKKQNKMSDDELSESNSDREEQQDDLPAQKMYQLYELLENKTRNFELTYNLKQIEAFLSQKTIKNKYQPIWMRRLQEKHKGKSHYNKKQQIRKNLSNPINGRIQESAQFNFLKKQKNKTTRVVSFGTSFIDMQLNPLEHNQLRVDRLYEDLLQKRNSTFYLKTGFLPNKKKQLQEKSMRKTYFSSNFTNNLNNQSNSEQICTGNSYLTPPQNYRVRAYGEKEINQICGNRRGNPSEQKSYKQNNFDIHRRSYRK